MPRGRTARPIPRRASWPDYLEYRPGAPLAARFRILRDHGELRIAGREIERRALTLDPEDDGAVARLAAEFERLGLDEALREAGAKPGDDILIGTHRLMYQPRRRR